MEPMSREGVLGITDTVKGVAMTATFSALSLVPVFGVFLLPFLPLPTVVVTARRGIAYGILSAIFSGILLTLILGKYFGVFVLLLTLLVGIFQGSILSRKLRPSIALIVGTVGSLLFFVAALYVSSYFFNFHIVKELLAFLYQKVEPNKALLLKYGFTRKEAFAFAKDMRSTISIIPIVLPAILGIASTTISLLNVVAAKRVLKKLSFEIESLPPFHIWDLPWFFSWGYILGIATELFIAKIPSIPLIVVGRNFYIFFGMLFAVQGFSVLSFYFQKSSKKVLIYAFLIMLVIFIPQVFQFLSWIGLFDIWFNYRKLPRPETQKLTEI